MGNCSTSSSSSSLPLRHSGSCPRFEAALRELTDQAKIFSSVSLYARGDISLEFASHSTCKDIPSRVDGVPDTGIIFKSANINYLLEMTNDAGLVYEKAQAYRFAVPRFRVISTLKGRIEPSIVLDYLSNDLKMKVFTADGSIRYHDFALLLFDHIRLNSDPNSTRLVLHANERKASNDLPKVPSHRSWSD